METSYHIYAKDKVLYCNLNEEDFEEFKHRMEQEITPKQKSLWFPFKPHRKASAFVYIDESDEDLSDEG